VLQKKEKRGKRRGNNNSSHLLEDGKLRFPKHIQEATVRGKTTETTGSWKPSFIVLPQKGER